MARFMADAIFERSSAGRVVPLLFSRTEASASNEFVVTCNSATCACPEVPPGEDAATEEGLASEALLAAKTPCCLAMISFSFSRAPHPMGSELLPLLAVCDTSCVPSFCALARFQ